MPKYKRRPPTPAVPAQQTAGPTDADLIEQEILDAERRHQVDEHRIAQRWAARMKALFWLGGAATLAMMFTAARTTAHARGAVLVVSLASVVINLVASYAIRRGASAAPTSFPVRYRSEMGNVSGAGNSLLLAVISGALTLLVIEAIIF